MATSGPRLTHDQRAILLTWIAADYSDKLIRHWLEERGWPVISKEALWQHRQKFAPEIEKLRAERRSAAITTGLALKEERVARLATHADELEEIKWVPDEKGKLHNEKAWRETLDDIAREMGHRKSGVEVTEKNGGPISIEATGLAGKLARLRAEQARAVSEEPDAGGGEGS